MIDLAASELKDRIQRGELRAVDLLDQYLAAIRQHDSKVKAFLFVDTDGARKQAGEVDAKRARGEKLGSLAGVPIAVKDILCTKGVTTTCGSKILSDYVPPYDAHVIERLKAADAVLVGKTNMDEFAMGSSTENSAFGPSRNPWDVERVPGGSSGGSAAAVAASLSPLAIGTDTGGSIRQPAALCGIAGMKPSYGRVSRYGLIAYGSSLDQAGPFGRSVCDIALSLGAIAGHDRRDSTSVDRPVPDYVGDLEKPFDSLTIGVPKEYFGDGLDAEAEKATRAALDVYRSRGAKIKDVSLPNSKHWVAVYYLVATAEASSNLARYDGVHYGHRAAEFNGLVDMVRRSRTEGFGAEVKRRIMLGAYALSSGYMDAYYLKAQRIRRLIRQDFDQAFSQCDVIVGPTTPGPAFKIGEKVDDPLAMYLSDIYTIGANLAGLPGISIPCGFTRSGLPLGLQILAAPFDESKLLRAARILERETDHHTKRPKLPT